MVANVTQCPECGWTGTASDYEVAGSDRCCPGCGHVMKRL